MLSARDMHSETQSTSVSDVPMMETPCSLMLPQMEKKKEIFIVYRPDRLISSKVEVPKARTSDSLLLATTCPEFPAPDGAFTPDPTISQPIDMSMACTIITDQDLISNIEPFNTALHSDETSCKSNAWIKSDKYVKPIIRLFRNRLKTLFKKIYGSKQYKWNQAQKMEHLEKFFVDHMGLPLGFFKSEKMILYSLIFNSEVPEGNQAMNTVPRSLSSP